MSLKTEPDANRALNDVLIILGRSLPMYLHDATPWVSANHLQTKQVLDRIVADNRQGVAHLTALLDARRFIIDRGEFPMDFTSLHDLSLDYLVPHLIDHGQRDTLAIERQLGRLNGDHEGRVIVQDILAAARRQLQSLKDAASQPVATKADG